MKASRGFSIIEVVVVVALIGLLLSIGVPSFFTWTQNLQIRAGAEALLAGYNIAKNEAIRRNVNVEMSIANNTGWDVHLASDPATSLQSRDPNEGSVNVTSNITPNGAFTVTFNGMGRVAPNSDGSDTVTQVDLDNPQISNATDRRKLRVTISTGGAVRLCDPSVASTDNRACK
jgi:type IV fimbrial biogenesis protein FimT